MEIVQLPRSKLDREGLALCRGKPPCAVSSADGAAPDDSPTTLLGDARRPLELWDLPALPHERTTDLGVELLPARKQDGQHGYPEPLGAASPIHSQRLTDNDRS